MSQHTPGPCGCYYQVAVLKFPLKGRIVYCPTHAAAPDLLAALEEFATMAEQNNYHAMDMALDRARAAIAKAKEPKTYAATYKGKPVRVTIPE
jgi:hypothetical protein